MFSQRNEETYILRHSNRDGRFLDVGAYDGKTFSNTRALALRGWGGVCLEPSPIPFVSLEKLYKNNDKVKVHRLAVGKSNGKFSFWDSEGDAISSFDESHVKIWKKKANTKWKKILVDTVTVKRMFERFGYDFDFINIDTEGTSVDIFLEFSFLKLKKLKLICIEHDRKCDEVLKKIKPYRFREIFRNGENLILVRK